MYYRPCWEMGLTHARTPTLGGKLTLINTLLVFVVRNLINRLQIFVLYFKMNSLVIVSHITGTNEYTFALPHYIRVLCALLSHLPGVAIRPYCIIALIAIHDSIYCSTSNIRSQLTGLWREVLSYVASSGTSDKFYLDLVYMCTPGQGLQLYT